MVDNSSKCVFVLFSMLGRVKNIQYSSCLYWVRHIKSSNLEDITRLPTCREGVRIFGTCDVGFAVFMSRSGHYTMNCHETIFTLWISVYSKKRERLILEVRQQFLVLFLFFSLEAFVVSKHFAVSRSQTYPYLHLGPFRMIILAYFWL